MFEADIRKNQLTKEQLCQKYKLSLATVNRYYKNYREHGFVKFQKQINYTRPNELIKKLLIQNQDLSKKIKREKPKIN